MLLVNKFFELLYSKNIIALSPPEKCPKPIAEEAGEKVYSPISCWGHFQIISPEILLKQITSPISTPENESIFNASLQPIRRHDKKMMIITTLTIFCLLSK